MGEFHGLPFNGRPGDRSDELPFVSSGVGITAELLQTLNMIADILGVQRGLDFNQDGNIAVFQKLINFTLDS